MVLQRTFSSFPGGWAGAALLILRTFVGGTILIETIFAVADVDSLLILCSRLTIAVVALSLILGLLTPVACAVVAVVGAMLLVNASPAAFFLVDSRMALFELIVMTSALGILGPGARSCDAFLFGRREVTIRSRQTGDTAAK